MPSITGGLNGASAGRFLDVSGGVGVLFPSTTSRIQGVFVETKPVRDEAFRG